MAWQRWVYAASSIYFSFFLPGRHLEVVLAALQKQVSAHQSYISLLGLFKKLFKAVFD